MIVPIAVVMIMVAAVGVGIVAEMANSSLLAVVIILVKFRVSSTSLLI